MQNEQIRVLCVKLGISLSELARRCGKTPQAFNQKLLRQTFTPAELHEIAERLGCEYESAFILSDGQKIKEDFGMKQTSHYLTDEDIERRCRYRLKRHGLRMHRRKNADGTTFYWLYEINGDDSEPDANNPLEAQRFFTLKRLINYCETLQEKEADWKA